MPCTPGVCQCTGCLNDEREEAEQVRENQKRSLAEAVRKGCNCKKNYCRKNYCICHGAGLTCDKSLCHCTECFNYDDAPPVPTSAANEGADVKKQRRKVEKRESIPFPQGAVVKSKMPSDNHRRPSEAANQDVQWTLHPFVETPSLLTCQITICWDRAPLKWRRDELGWLWRTKKQSGIQIRCQKCLRVKFKLIQRVQNFNCFDNSDH